MAHRLWALNEIVSTIAANLVSDHALASAVAFACCSKWLEEPSLCKIWRNLSSLAPLIKCFPPDIWEVEDKKLFFKRSPHYADWTRFQQKYASKVRHLKVSSPDEVIDPAAFHLLQQLSYYSPLLPDLVSLNWQSGKTFVPLIPLFISRSLASITIDVPCEASPMLSPILARLSTSSPDIRKIQFRRLYADRSTEEASSQLLMQCNPNRLRRYNVDVPISASALRHIMQLPLLEEFWLVVASVQLPDPLPTVVFPSLRHLGVRYDGDPTWLNKLLAAIENPVLSSISVWCLGPDVAQFMETFHLTMSCRLHECLQAFLMVTPGNWVPQFRITSQIIACSLSFKNLTNLKMASECSEVCQTSDLTDDDIDLLTNAMPLLETLAIGGKPCNVPSQITFKSLSTISRRCPRLTTLQIHFNPTLFIIKVIADSESGVIAPGLLDIPSSELCSVTTIDVGSIPFRWHESKKPYIMALGLVGVFPRLEKLKYDGEYWKAVDDLIRVCRLGLRSCYL